MTFDYSKGEYTYMEWKLYDEHGLFIQDVNCQYDSLDIAQFDNDAIVVKVNFKNKEAHIIERNEPQMET